MQENVESAAARRAGAARVLPFGGAPRAFAAVARRLAGHAGRQVAVVCQDVEPRSLLVIGEGRRPGGLGATGLGPPRRKRSRCSPPSCCCRRSWRPPTRSRTTSTFPVRNLTAQPSLTPVVARCVVRFMERHVRRGRAARRSDRGVAPPSVSGQSLEAAALEERHPGRRAVARGVRAGYSLRAFGVSSSQGVEPVDGPRRGCQHRRELALGNRGCRQR